MCWWRRTMKMEAEQGLTSYYSILGVSSESSIEEIKRAYRKLAMVRTVNAWFSWFDFSFFKIFFAFFRGCTCNKLMNWVVLLYMVQQWHPDRWTRTPALLGEAKRKFQQIQEAYSGKLLTFGFNCVLFLIGFECANYI